MCSFYILGDVVGCLIDVNNKKFIFYLNGKKVEVTKRISQKLRLVCSGLVALHVSNDCYTLV